MRSILLVGILAAGVALTACGNAATGGDYLSDGTYQGTDRNGTEYTLEKSGNQVKLNGAETEIDDTRKDTAFVAKFSPGKPTWDCRPSEKDTAAACTLSLSGKSLSIDLLKVNE